MQDGYGGCEVRDQGCAASLVVETDIEGLTRRMLESQQQSCSPMVSKTNRRHFLVSAAIIICYTLDGVSRSAQWN